MKISYNWLQEYISKKLPKPEKLADLLTMHSFEVERFNKRGNDYIFDIDVLPNRAQDCLSHIGIAREAAALINTKCKTQNVKLNEKSNLKTRDFVSVEVKDKELCPRYTARAMTNIKVGPSPKWLREKLEAIGQQSINNIVDATNYVMFETGQPLHAFDADKLAGNKLKKIIIRKAKKGEKITTLDGERYDLDSDVLVIADSNQPIAIAGIKGGKKAEVSKTTKTIILESANFNLNSIYKNSKKLTLQTEASLRFEHGLDSNLTLQAIDRLASVIKEVAGGDIAAGIIDVSLGKILPKKVVVTLSKINSLLGIEISEKEIIKIFNSLEFKVKVKKDKDIWFVVEVPTWRLDLEIAEDLIEEIGRIYGYEKIPASPPVGALYSQPLDDLFKLKNKIKVIMEGLGLTETYNYSFVSEDDLKKIKANSKNYIELKNPLSLDLKYLRRDLLINLFKNVRDNFNNYFDKVSLFELGKVYILTSKEKEKTMLAGILAEKEKTDKLFYRAKGIVDGLLGKMGITGQWYDNFQATPEWSNKSLWHPTNSAEIKIDNQEIGYIGEINPEILSRFKIKGRVAAFNINFEILAKLASEELIYTPPSKYPAVIRDIAILVNSGDTVADVLNVINSAGRELVQDVDLFDIYEGDRMPNGKKNLAFHIIYQSNKKTLTDKEVDKINSKIIRALSAKTGWEVRK